MADLKALCIDNVCNDIKQHHGYAIASLDSNKEVTLAGTFQYKPIPFDDYFANGEGVVIENNQIKITKAGIVDVGCNLTTQQPSYVQVLIDNTMIAGAIRGGSVGWSSATARTIVVGEPGQIITAQVTASQAAYLTIPISVYTKLTVLWLPL